MQSKAIKKKEQRTSGIQGSLRINKALAQAGVCSRRRADELIQAGKVLVNGQVAAPGIKVSLFRDKIEVEGRVLSTILPDYTYLILNKPIHVVTTVKDPEGRKTVIDLLPQEYAHLRLYPVGRLDYFSQGLLLLTNDGDLANRLMHPRWHQAKTYHLVVRGAVKKDHIRTLQKGMRLPEGETLAPVQVRILEAGEKSSRLELILTQGINRQIRRMCKELGLTVLRLERVRQGVLELGSLPPGSLRPLTAKELTTLLASVQLAAR